MEDETREELQKALTETRQNLAHWIETAPEVKQEIVCCSDQDCAQDHVHALDQSLQRIAEGTFGMCEVCHEPVDDVLLKMDYTSSVCLGHFTEVELRQLESELELSQVVQRGLLPQQAPDIPGLAVAAFSRPAQIVSGDYFDFVRFKDGGHGIVMADVSGHGVAAGMLMSSLQTAFHTLVPAAESPLDVLERINHLYAHNIRVTSFVTVFFGKFDPATRMFTYGSAGHNAPYLHHADGNEEVLLHPTGPAIGLMEKFSVQLAQVQLHPDDTLVLYTDGVTEATNAEGVQWGLAALSRVISENHGLAPERLIEAILRALNTYTGGVILVDDLTLLACRVT